MKLEEVSREYSKNKSLYEHLKGEAVFILENTLKETDIKIHTIHSRVKGLDSFLKKVEDKQSDTPFDDINDIVGVRIICLFLEDITEIGEIIKSQFRVIIEDNKLESNDVTVFGYMSVHYIVN